MSRFAAAATLARRSRIVAAAAMGVLCGGASLPANAQATWAVHETAPTNVEIFALPACRGPNATADPIFPMDRSYLDIPAANNRPDALVFVTQVVRERGGGAYNTPTTRLPFAVEYDATRQRWAIVADGPRQYINFPRPLGELARTAPVRCADIPPSMPLGLAFNVLVLPPSANAAVAGPGARTLPGTSPLRMDPRAVVLLTARRTPATVPAAYAADARGEPVGPPNFGQLAVAWDGTGWAMLNRLTTVRSPAPPIRPGLEINVALFPRGANAFIHYVCASSTGCRPAAVDIPNNVVLGGTALDYPGLNGNPDAIILVTAVANGLSGRPPNDGAFSPAVVYNRPNGRWYLFQPGSPWWRDDDGRGGGRIDDRGGDGTAAFNIVFAAGPLTVTGPGTGPEPPVVVATARCALTRNQGIDLDRPITDARCPISGAIDLFYERPRLGMLIPNVVPQNGARFAWTMPSTSARGRDGCLAAEMSFATTPIAPGDLVERRFYCYATSDRNIGELQVITNMPVAGTLQIQYTTWRR